MFWRAFGLKTRQPGKEDQLIACWRAFILVPILPLIVELLLILIFWLCGSSHVFAQELPWDEAIPYQYNTSGAYSKAYCLFTYDVLGPDDDIYTCKQVRVHWVSTPTDTYDPVVAARHYCWSYQYGGWGNGYGYGNHGGTWDGIIFKTKLEFSMSPPAYSPAAPCIRKQDSDPPLTCDINIRSVIAGAFSNKFPLDLFTGFNADTQPVAACPSFTVEGQTFQLCYINKLTATLKYVLLLVFVISSVLAL
jgi:hypothetical protein